MYHEPGILEKTAGALGRLRKRGFTMMTGMLRVMLILVSAFTMAFMMRKIRQAKMEIEAALFWTAMALMLVVFAVFPSVADLCASGDLFYRKLSFPFYDFPADCEAVRHNGAAFPARNPPEGAGAEACP